jgi:hypothetical protein
VVAVSLVLLDFKCSRNVSHFYVSVCVKVSFSSKMHKTLATKKAKKNRPFYSHDLRAVADCLFVSVIHNHGHH